MVKELFDNSIFTPAEQERIKSMSGDLTPRLIELFTLMSARDFTIEQVAEAMATLMARTTIEHSRLARV